MAAGREGRFRAFLSGKTVVVVSVESKTSVKIFFLSQHVHQIRQENINTKKPSKVIARESGIHLLEMSLRKQVLLNSS